MKKIEFIIARDGTVTENPLEGFDGVECESETANIEQALGKVTSRSSKRSEDQYRAPTVHQKRG